MLNYFCVESDRVEEKIISSRVLYNTLAGSAVGLLVFVWENFLSRFSHFFWLVEMTLIYTNYSVEEFVVRKFVLAWEKEVNAMHDFSVMYIPSNISHKTMDVFCVRLFLLEPSSSRALYSFLESIRKDNCRNSSLYVCFSIK